MAVKQLRVNYSEVPQNFIHAIVKANTTRKDFIVDEILRRKREVVGVYRLIMKDRSNNFRASGIQGILRHIKAKGIPFISYERALKDGEFYNSKVIKDLEAAKLEADVIIANRNTEVCADVADKVYARDRFGSDS